MSLLSMGLTKFESSGSGGIDWETKSWIKDYEMVLASNETLEDLITECIEAKKYGLDIETTGLDARVFPIKTEEGIVRRTRDIIVGICLAPSGVKKGIYIPLRHKKGANVSYSLFVKAFKRLVESDSVAVFHNAKFDQEFLEWPGHEPLGVFEDHTKWEDTQILAYLRNPKQKFFGLKRLSKEELGKEMIELSELFPPGTEKLDFSLLDPSQEGVVEYACSDAICTVELEDKIREEALLLKGKSPNGKPHRQDVVYAIEKMCVTATRWMERSRVHIDLEKVKELIQLAQVETITSLDKMYAEASKVLGRDITPVYHYLLKRKIREVNPELEAHEDPEHRLKKLIESSREEGDRLRRLSAKNDYGIRKKLKKDPELEKLVLREDPGKRAGISLLVEYDLLSSQKLGVLLFDLGVPNPKKTDSGQIATDKQTIDRILQDKKMEKKFPFLELVRWSRENQNALGKLEALFEDTNKEDNSLWIKFKIGGTDTGRFATPGDKKYKITGGTRFNLQSMPATYDPKRPPSLLRLRECIRARSGKLLVAVDFSGVELRIVSNLSMESKWIDAFFTCSECKQKFDRGDGTVTPEAPPKYCPTCGSDRIGDIHTMTALAIYGDGAQERDDWKQLRGNGKATNFALCYGGSGKAVVRSTGCSENEGYRIKKQFDATYDLLKKWWDSTKRQARKDKYVRTAFGRQYPVPDINHEDNFWKAKAERNAINAPIQGSSADITKLSMGRIYRTCKARGWLEKVLMIATMHDELVFEIDFDILEEALEVIADEMARNNVVKNRKWAVPLTLDIEAGDDWTVPWNIYKIQYKVSLRKELENPDLSLGEMNHILKRMLQIVSKDQIKEKGFECIDWPEPLKASFKGASEKISESGKRALERAYAHLFKNESPPVTRDPSKEDLSKKDPPKEEPPAVNGGSLTTFDETLSFDSEESEVSMSPKKYKLQEVLSVELAVKLGAALANSYSEHGTNLLLETKEGGEISLEGIGPINFRVFEDKMKN